MKSENQFSQDKKSLRKILRQKRLQITDKENRDIEICRRFLESELYLKSDTVFVYCSLNDEINTDLIVNTALEDNKKVAVPCCLDKNGTMEFYYINSSDELHTGSFNVREPDINTAQKAENPDNAIVVVPGLCFDKNRYRLGYGKGYYDRYLQIHTLISVGLCYNSLIADKIPTDIYDKRVDYIITENQFLS